MADPISVAVGGEKSTWFWKSCCNYHADVLFPGNGSLDN
jgi:hypothetical protein